MFCRKCGAEIDNDSAFCHKCGTMVISNLNNLGESAVKSEVNKQIDASKSPSIVDEKIITQNISKKIRYIVLGISAFVVVFICIVAVIKHYTRDPIIGTWKEERTYINGVFSEDDPSYLTDRDPYIISFFKDGSMRISGGYSWHKPTTGTWENITTQADEYPQYILTADGESAHFFKGTGDSLSWLVNGYGHDVIVFKKK